MNTLQLKQVMSLKVLKVLILHSFPLSFYQGSKIISSIDTFRILGSIEVKWDLNGIV